MNKYHPFEVGGRYRNRIGDYVVTAINGESMTARYDDGREQVLNVATQTHIWQSILDEELVIARRSDFNKHDFDADERLITWPVRLLVEEVLHARFAPPYPPDITDLVCQAIENHPVWLTRYHDLAAELGERGESATWKINNAIGWWTKDLTGMVTVKPGVESKSRLIKSYSRLGYPHNG